MTGEPATRPPREAVPFRTRLTALFAADGRSAVLLRRGPKTHFNLICWDLRHDRFEPGQWMTGSVRLCDLSPSGDKLMYWAEQYRRRPAPEPAAEAYEPMAERPPKVRPGRKVPRYLAEAEGSGSKRRPREVDTAWTAISTPPYFSALAIWPSKGRWTGGGGFLSDRALFLNENDEGLVPIANVPMPADISVHSLAAAKGDGGIHSSATGPLYAPNPLYGLVYDEARMRLWQGLVELFPQLDWVHRRDGDLFFSGAGRLYRLEGADAVAPQDYVARARLIADFSSDRFRLVSPPAAALRW